MRVMKYEIKQEADGPGLSVENLKTNRQLFLFLFKRRVYCCWCCSWKHMSSNDVIIVVSQTQSVRRLSKR